uniref:Uncharacterized protein n=1 Tax=Trypanosoma congolense (strain IL3000) TaxID=1068625 RepID=G0UZN3_TRYCI|nr:hypothetical protein, unlikely [Trypanosoma congolense IL3000]
MLNDGRSEAMKQGGKLYKFIIFVIIIHVMGSLFVAVILLTPLPQLCFLPSFRTANWWRQRIGGPSSLGSLPFLYCSVKAQCGSTLFLRRVHPLCWSHLTVCALEP